MICGAALGRMNVTNLASSIAGSGVGSVSSSTSALGGGFVDGFSLCRILRVSLRRVWVLKMDLRFGLLVDGFEKGLDVGNNMIVVWKWKIFSAVRSERPKSVGLRVFISLMDGGRERVDVWIMRERERISTEADI